MKNNYFGSGVHIRLIMIGKSKSWLARKLGTTPANVTHIIQGGNQASTFKDDILHLLQCSEQLLIRTGRQVQKETSTYKNLEAAGRI